MSKILMSFMFFFFNKKMNNSLILVSLIFVLFKKFSILPNSFFKLFVFDKISLFFLLLCFIMIFFMVILNWSYSYFKKKMGMKNIYLLLFFISIFFLVDKIFLFYMFFELSIIPAFFLILGWGKNPERFNAMFYLFSYTFMGSFPFLFSLMKNYDMLYSLKYYILFSLKSFSLKSFFLVFFLLPFIIKLPLYFFHSWLPKAHVEAPTVGSMILASLLLKMGAYGIIRFPLFKSFNSSFFWNLILGWAMINLLFIGFMIFRLKDLKIIIAFSSINHMLLVMISWYIFSKKNVMFCMLLNMGHGLISSKLFFCIGKFYESSHSRKILLKKGMNHMNSLFSFFWFCILMAKSSAPTSISLFSEMGMMSHFMSFSFLIKVFLFSFVVLGGVYCIFLYIKMFHGKNLFFKNYNCFEKIFNLMSFLHLTMIFFFMFFFNKV